MRGVYRKITNSQGTKSQFFDVFSVSYKLGIILPQILTPSVSQFETDISRQFPEQNLSAPSLRRTLEA